MIRDHGLIRRIGLLLITGSMLVTACTTGAGGSPTSQPATPGPSAAASTGAAGSGGCASAKTTPITLTEWDQEVRGGIGPAIDQLNTEFMAANQGVKIVRQAKSFDDLKATEKLALADSSGPDVAQVNQGRPDMGAAVQAGLLLPLTTYASKYGWAKRWSAGVLARNTFSDDGKQFGTGSLYGVSITGEIVGLFYNKAKYQQLGLTIPKTFGEFEQQLATIKSKGEVPIAFGALDGDGLQIFASILETTVTPQWLNDWIYGRKNQSFNTPETKAAAAEFVKLSDNGDFTKGYAGIGYDDSAKLFEAGKGVYFWTGSWEGATLTGAAGEKFGFLRVPPQTAGGTSLSIGGVGLPWSIRKTTKNPDCAAAYLDFLTSDHAMQLVAKLGVLPGHSAPNATGTSALFNEMAAAFADANSKNEVGHYLDWAFPTAWDTFKAQLATLLAKQASPEQFVQAIDQEYQAYVSSLK